jgi:hypothetical protein
MRLRFLNVTQDNIVCMYIFIFLYYTLTDYTVQYSQPIANWNFLVQQTAVNTVPLKYVTTA